MFTTTAVGAPIRAKNGLQYVLTRIEDGEDAVYAFDGGEWGGRFAIASPKDPNEKPFTFGYFRYESFDEAADAALRRKVVYKHEGNDIDGLDFSIAWKDTKLTKAGATEKLMATIGTVQEFLYMYLALDEDISVVGRASIAYEFAREVVRKSNSELISYYEITLP